MCGGDAGESAADHGMVIPYPSEITLGHKMVWEAGMRRIGNEPLPAPSPCSVDGSCPTNGNPLTEEEVFAKQD